MALKHGFGGILRNLTLLLFPVLALAQNPGPAFNPDTLPCMPVSDYVNRTPGSPDPAFCADWNPEFAFRGFHCCPKPAIFTGRRRNRNVCDPGRMKSSFCDEMTPEQRKYSELGLSGKLGDVLQLIDRDMSRGTEQAYCSVNMGFLAWGRRLIPSAQNRIRLRTPKRCIDFGTNAMVGMLEWAGRQVNQQYSAPEYAKVHLLIGDISAPRGGCLTGRAGRRGHASHMTGQDVDVGYLTVKKNTPSPPGFHKKFDGKTNWWLIRKIFQNPYACVKVIFLDQRNINKLKDAARGDEDWEKYHRFIRHMKNHKNHFHVRIGNGPGPAGCGPGAQPENEENDEEDSSGAEAARDQIMTTLSGVKR